MYVKFLEKGMPEMVTKTLSWKKLGGKEWRRERASQIIINVDLQGEMAMYREFLLELHLLYGYLSSPTSVSPRCWTASGASVHTYLCTYTIYLGRVSRVAFLVVATTSDQWPWPLDPDLRDHRRLLGLGCCLWLWATKEMTHDLDITN